MGAHDGVTFSNTYYLERHLDWTGVAVEPLSKAYMKLMLNRKCNIENCCISNYNGDAQFLQLEGYTEMLSGIVDKYDKLHLKRIERELHQHGGSRKYMTVPCFTLEYIVDKYKLGKIDYLSIDTEGGEFEILESIDFDNTEISVISVENNQQGMRLCQLLKKYGYELIAVIGDEVYRKK